MGLPTLKNIHFSKALIGIIFLKVSVIFLPANYCFTLDLLALHCFTGEPPYFPEVSGATDTSNFDVEIDGKGNVSNEYCL